MDDVARVEVPVRSEVEEPFTEERFSSKPFDMSSSNIVASAGVVLAEGKKSRAAALIPGAAVDDANPPMDAKSTEDANTGMPLSGCAK